jgi:hypothetical protein
MNLHFLRTASAGIFLASFAGTALSSDVSIVYGPPTGDRWMYPFANGTGTELRAPAFATPGQTTFDDRDSQFLTFWNTDGVGQIPSGLGEETYRIKSLRVTVVVSSDQTFNYDPTADSVRNFLPTSDPNYLADTDPGKPVELFGVGFRGIYQTQEFQENSPFPFGSMVKGTRNAYPAIFDEAGIPTDVSNDILNQIDHAPFALATTDAVAPGQLVPSGATMTFEVGLCDTSVRNYIARSLNSGRLYFLVTTLQPGVGGPGGGTGVTYPDFVTKETFPGFAPQLTLSVDLGSPADLTGNGEVDLEDFFAFFNAFDTTDPAADVTLNCQVDLEDFFMFLNAFDAG